MEVQKKQRELSLPVAVCSVCAVGSGGTGHAPGDLVGILDHAKPLLPY